MVSQSRIAKRNRKRGIRYKAIIRHKGKVIITKTFASKREAAEWGRQQDLDKSLSPVTSITLQRLAELYLEHWSQFHKDTKNQQRILQHWEASLCCASVNRLQPSDIRSILTHVCHTYRNFPYFSAGCIF
jgi:hypothetical protein